MVSTHVSCIHALLSALTWLTGSVIMLCPHAVSQCLSLAFASARCRSLATKPIVHPALAWHACPFYLDQHIDVFSDLPRRIPFWRSSLQHLWIPSALPLTSPLCVSLILICGCLGRPMLLIGAGLEWRAISLDLLATAGRVCEHFKQTHRSIK